MMRLLNSFELESVFGAGQSQKSLDDDKDVSKNSYLNMFTDSPNNPMNGGSGSAVDEAVTNFQIGNVFTGAGQMIGGAPEIIGNGLDGLVCSAGDAFYNYANDIYQSYNPPAASEELGLRPAQP